MADKIPSDNGKGFYTISGGTDFEFVNPIEYKTQTAISYQTSVIRDILMLEDSSFSIEIAEKVANKQATEFWNEMYQEIIATEIPVNFLTLLNAESKSEQEKLLRDQFFTPSSLQAYIFKAFTDYGFVYSQYVGTNYHKTDMDALPTLANVKETGEVEKVGETTMSDKQIKHTIFQRKKIVANFLDNGNTWHCFFITYKSIRGEEDWENGQPHYHYISDKWNIPRDEIVKGIKSTDYSGTRIHIKLLDYGNQPK